MRGTVNTFFRGSIPLDALDFKKERILIHLGFIAYSF